MVLLNCGSFPLLKVIFWSFFDKDKLFGPNSICETQKCIFLQGLNVSVSHKSFQQYSMPVTEPQQNILNLLLCLPSSSPSPSQLWTPLKCCRYWSVLGSGSNIISAQVYLQPLTRLFTLLFQCLTARSFRIALSQAASFQVACIPKSLACAEWLIRTQIAHEFSVQSPSSRIIVAVE